jgi:hypothetical protein
MATGPPLGWKPSGWGWGVAERRAYARQAEIDRAVTAAKRAGMDVGSIELSPNGAIRLIDRSAIPKAENDFDRWEDRL